MEKTRRGGRERSLEKLVIEATEHLRHLHYSRGTVKNRRGHWHAFVAYARKHRTAARFSVDLVERFLEERRARVGRLSSARSAVATSMRVLTEFVLHGSFLMRRSMAGNVPLPRHWEALLADYERFYAEQHRNPVRSLRGRLQTLRRFVCLLEHRGVHSPAGIDAEAFSAFIGTRLHVKPKTLSTAVGHLRSFLRYLALRGLADSRLIDQVPKVRVYSADRLPTIWTAQDLQALLGAVDRASPAGKRDYAILLLAARLGLRAGDIRDLRLDQLDWPRSRIRLVQSKTGTPLELPLPEDVGQALIDYLRYGRPEASYREVFLRQHAPFRPFGRNNNLHQIITRYRRQAGIELPRQCRQGLHSLRHTLASRLLEAGVSLDLIAGVMGHLTPETTRQYLRIDVESLRRAALDPEEVFHG
jgi:integrase